MGIEELRASGYWTEREGRAAVALWKRSGETLATWARSNGLSRTRLSYWTSRLEQRSPSLTLAPVAVLAASAARGALTIELRSGRAVRVEGEFDDAALARVIAIAERAC
jgi:hypothetical protein